VLNNIVSYLKEKEIFYELEKDIKELVSFKVGGYADIVIYPSKIEQIKGIIDNLNSNQIKYFVLGNGTNTYFSDNGYKGAIISTKLLNKAFIDDNRLIAQCGCKIHDCAIMACESNLTGMEFTYGLPGCIGGCIYMNASAFNKDMSNIVEITRVLDIHTGEITELNSEEHKYGMKYSVFMDRKEYFILEAVFKLSGGEHLAIKNQMNEYLEKRINSQPLDLPSAGSVFKRPLVGFSSKYIDDAGLKGKRIGDAMVSHKHAGFIVNMGNASSKDINDLIHYIKEDVYKKYGVMLEEEIIYIE
jgi:UDP-N-acetylmuramate dehydrogenase